MMIVSPLMPLSVLPPCDRPSRDQAVVSACSLRDLAADCLREGPSVPSRYEYQEPVRQEPRPLVPLVQPQGYQCSYQYRDDSSHSCRSTNYYLSPSIAVMNLSRRQQ